MNQLYARSAVFNAQSLAGQYPAVDFGVQMGEIGRQIQFLIIDGEGSIRRLTLSASRFGQVLLVDRKVPADLRFLKLQRAGHARWFIDMNLAAFDFSKDP